MASDSEASNRPVVAILGATGGIGSALSRTLAGSTRLYLAGRDSERVDSLALDLGAEDHGVVDAGTPGSIAEWIAGVHKNAGKLDGIACCIGSLLLKPAHATTDGEWNDVLTANLTAAFETVRASGKAMRTTGGSIVLVSSAAAQIGLPNHEAIAAAKAGVIGLVRSAAATYARNGIRVNCVAPGMVRTSLTSSITENEIALKGTVAMHPLGRIGEPDDIARAMAWLLDADQSWVTGQVLGVDGGLAGLKAKGRA